MGITVSTSREYNDLLKQGYVYTPGGGFTSPVRGLPQPKPIAPAPVMSGPAESTVTGIEPQALDSILYGKEISEFVGGGRIRIGGRLIEGPFFDNPSSTTENPVVEYIASFGHYANGASGTIAITEFSLRGRVVWTVADGATIDDLDVEFRLGTEDQLPFDSSITRFGSRALPYKGHILARVIVSLNQFAGIVPFPSVLVEDSSFGDPDDGIPRQDALGIILRLARLEADEYEVDVTGSWDACIIPEKSDMLTLLQMFQEYPNWDITFTDKLRITERAAYSIDLNLTRGKIMKDSWSGSRQEPLTQPRERLLRFIDPDRDYEFNTATARQEIFPLATTSSVESETIELPIVESASTATSDNFFSLFAQDVANLKMEWIGTVDTFGLEPGDAVRFNDTTTGLDLFMRVSEISRNWSDFTIDVRADAAYNCGIVTSTPPVATFIHHYLNNTSIAAQEFTGVDFGTEAADRLIIVVAAGQTNDRTINSITIGGVTATIHANIHHTSVAFNDPALAIASLLVPTGTSGTVVVTYSAVLAGSTIDVYTLTGYQSATPVDAQTGIGKEPSTQPELSITVQPGGTVIAGYLTIETIASPTAWDGLVSWTGLDDVDTDQTGHEAVYSMWVTCAHGTGLAGGTLDISVDSPSDEQELIAAVSWR